MEQTTRFGGDPTNVGSSQRSKLTTQIAFATPSAPMTSAPTSHGVSGNVDGSVIELKPMHISGNESETDVLEFKRPRASGGDDSV